MITDNVNTDKILVTELKYSLANPRGLEVLDVKKAPLLDQRIRVINTKDFSKSNHFKLEELDYELTIIDATPLVIIENGVCHYEYNVITKEFPNVVIKGWNYEFIKTGL